MATAPLFRGAHLPLILQAEVAECGLACLAMVASYLGLRTDLAALRGRFPTSLSGISMLTLTEYAQRLSLSTRALSLSLEELPHLKTPAILHWGLNHFVVLRRATAKEVVVHDPAIGVRHLSYAEVSRDFTGCALEFDPSTDFSPADERRRVSVRALMGKLDGWWQAFGLLFAISLAVELLVLAMPRLNQFMIDDVLMSNDASLRNVIMLGLLLLILTQWALLHMRGVTILYLTTHLNLQWVGDVFGRLVRLPMSWFETRQLGDVLSRFGSVGPIQDLLTTRAVGAVLDGITAILTMIVMILYSPLLAGVVGATVLLYAAVRALSYRPLHTANLEGLTLAAKEQTCLMETIRAIGPIKLFGRELDRRAHWLAMKTDTINRNVRTQVMGLWFANINMTIGAISAALVLWLGAGLIMEGSFTVGMLIALTVYSGMFTARMSALINVFIDYKMLSLHCERLADIVLEAIEPEVEHGRDVDQLVPQLELVKVSYRYSDTEPWVLRNIDLTIEPGDSIAIAGPSGCGKTTLIKLIVGNLKPTFGEIRYGGIPISQLGVRSYRRALAAVMQDDVLLSGSLKENICFYDERPEMDRIRRCAELAQIDADIDRMRMGYETIVADMGSSLSGGQKQRVLLARALYKRPKILVMDEATSALDGAVESEVSGAIAELNMTRILVAHRLETIATARRLVALQDGSIVYDAPLPTKNGASENTDTPLPDGKN
ncbi:ATP-binding cassette domain-containing protein [Massilia sp. CCM 8733]|uniref:ATP-binding cassette domain-containing protein n=1 Tax=Massilia mucilaginosa TaxID=2609282 RepID=A0ABX0P3F2_9BURK|nr:peptidase domain-containing ABC transporter [Massilia mucilaginosa]NHZ93879.1 ATP-binding cassette domain-containing protein [Massilia mucilaginosa]